MVKMEKGESAESSRSLTIRPIVLPPIPASLRAAWNENEQKLNQAQIMNYLVWIQKVTRAAYVERVVQFVRSYSQETATAQVDGRTIDFSVTRVARELKLPQQGQLIEEMPGLTQSQYETWFNGTFTSGCQRVSF